MNNQPEPNCPKCGSPIPEDAPQKLCPECVFSGMSATPLARSYGSRTSPPSVEKVAAHFPELEVLELIGAGGMGEVWRARDTKLARDVALKVLPDHLSDDAKALARFESEAKAVAALSHPHILAIHDFGRIEGVSFVVTELLLGETLRAVLLRRAVCPHRGDLLGPLSELRHPLRDRPAGLRSTVASALTDAPSPRCSGALPVLPPD